LHDIVFGFVGGGNDFFRDAESRADFGAREFAVLQELKIAAGEFWFDDFVDAPEENGAIGGACFALPIPESSNDLLPLVVPEKLIRTNDQAGIGIVFDGAAHESRGSEIGSGSLVGYAQGREAAPEVERVGEFFKPDFFGEKELGFQRSEPPVSDVTPADEFVVFDYMMNMRRIEKDNIFESPALGGHLTPALSPRGGEGERRGGDTAPYLLHSGIFVDWDAEALAAKHQPDDAEVPSIGNG